ncbi:hypothetical protein [Streptomyces sp. NPDC046909]|uniref:hypothetical protein n=1 Tax=Streptomyces sp. NPDC046909 TaxID=3155617 RepID=UPI00340E631E
MTTVALEDTRHAARAEEIAGRLAALHGTDAARLTFRAWIPRSARKQCRRLFVQSSVDGTPLHVAKVPLDPDDAMVAREWSVLTSLDDLGLPRPHPVAELDSGFVMSYVPARDFPDVMRATPPQGWPGLLGSALELAATVRSSGGGEVPGDPVETAAGYLPGLTGVTEPTLRYLERAAVGPSHGDLGPWNLRVADDGRIGLIDWEDHRAVGVPALDALNVVWTAALLAFPDYGEHGFDWLYDRVFHEDNAFRAAADHALCRYTALTGDDVDDLVGLTPLICRWMIRRIEDQGRPAGHLFYGPFADRFEAENPRWTSRTSQSSQSSRTGRSS